MKKRVGGTKLFIYGTLKRGERLHFYLRRSKYLGRSYVLGFKLYYSLHGYPVLYERSGWKKKVWGEVFLVHKRVLNNIRTIETQSGYKEGQYNGMIFFYKTEEDYKNHKYHLLPIARFTTAREREWLEKLKKLYRVWT